MCKQNPTCSVLDGSCRCAYIVYTSTAHPFPFPSLGNAEITMKNAIFKLISQQAEMVHSIGNTLKLSIEKIAELTPNSFVTNTDQVSEIASTSSPSQILSFLSGTSTNFQYFLELASDLSMPLYKERVFSMTINIVNTSGMIVVLPKSVNFKIMVFTTEMPPKQVKINTSGDKIFKGASQIESASILSFKKIAIKEVSSHFRNGCFFLVVQPIENSSIQPLVIENVIVKARKLKTNKEVKKSTKNIKLSESNKE